MYERQIHDRILYGKIKKDNSNISETQFKKVEQILHDAVKVAKNSNEPMKVGSRAQFLEVYPDGSIDHYVSTIK